MLEERRISEPLGLQALAALRAEEEPWLEQCFVPPDDFALMGGKCSIAVFGKPGSGKSAVCRMLLREAGGASARPRYLIVPWQPMPPAFAAPTGFQSVPGQVAYILDACALALLTQLVAEPQRWYSAPSWARRFLVWFIRRFLREDAESRLGPEVALHEETGLQLLRELQQEESDTELIAVDDWPLIGAELSKVAQRLGWEGVWIIVDGIEPWFIAQPHQVRSALAAFFATLPLFQEASLAYKAFLPDRLQPALASVAGIERYRVHPYRLHWQEEQLVTIVERRLTLAFGHTMSLQDLCAAKELKLWLARIGGDSPRAWLEAIRPLVSYAFAHRESLPVSTKTWKELRRQHPPRLELDEARACVRVGGREIPADAMTGGAFRLLRYLYQNAGRPIPWEELYYRGYRELPYIPRVPEDEGYEERTTWGPILYTRLSDLRKVIEPDPSDPFYIETLRGQRVIFHLPW